MLKDMLREQLINSKKQAEEILKQIAMHNKVIERAISIENVVCRRMKQTLEKVKLLQKGPFPPEAESKLKQFEEKFTNFEKLGVIVAQMVPSKQKVLFPNSHDTQNFNDITSRFKNAFPQLIQTDAIEFKTDDTHEKLKLLKQKVKKRKRRR